MTHQHTAMNHSKSYDALKKIVEEFAHNSTKGQEAMQIGRVEAGATAPTTAWSPLAAETSEDSWEEYGAINAWVHNSGGPAKDYVTCPGTVPLAKARARARIRMAKSNHDGNKRSNQWDAQGRWKANTELSLSRQGVPEG